MAEKYFEKFPIITYANNAVRNITERAVVLNSVYNNPIFYYPYDIQQGERPDNIADRYYRDEYMGWILHLTNKVIDPYYDWYMDQTTFEAFIAKKYGSYVNAISKISHYRNNWYSYPDMISNSAHDSLNPELWKFYEPVYSDVYRSTTPLGYKRKQVDWKVTTNKIVSYSAYGLDFIQDEIIDVYCDSNLLGSGQVCSRSTTTTVIQHTSGDVTNDVCLGTFSLVGRESNVSQTYAAAPVLLTQNIPAAEMNYWDPVYYYDYENEINEKNKTIQVLKSDYSVQISKELKNILR